MPKGINEGHSVRIFIRLTPELRDQAREGARRAGVELSEWIRDIITKAAPVRSRAKVRRRKLARR